MILFSNLDISEVSKLQTTNMVIYLNPFEISIQLLTKKNNLFYLKTKLELQYVLYTGHGHWIMEAVCTLRARN